MMKCPTDAESVEAADIRCPFQVSFDLVGLASMAFADGIDDHDFRLRKAGGAEHGRQVRIADQ